MKQVSGGLAEVVAGSTAISEVTQQGLGYRGYDIAELAAHCRYEEVAYLLLYGELPGREQMEAFRSRVNQAMQLPAAVAKILESIPPSTPLMDVLRTSVSARRISIPMPLTCRARRTCARPRGFLARFPRRSVIFLPGVLAARCLSLGPARATPPTSSSCSPARARRQRRGRDGPLAGALR